MEAIRRYQEASHESEDKATTLPAHHSVCSVCSDPCSNDRINPFAAHDCMDVASSRILPALSAFEPFELSFSKFEIFSNNTSTTLYLAPDDNVRAFLFM